jgi:hypothetical protein
MLMKKSASRLIAILIASHAAVACSSERAALTAPPSIVTINSARFDSANAVLRVSGSQDSAVTALAKSWMKEGYPALAQLLQQPAWAATRMSQHDHSLNGPQTGRELVFDEAPPTLAEIETLIDDYEALAPAVISGSSVSAFGPLNTIVGTSTMTFTGFGGSTSARTQISGNQSHTLEMDGEGVGEATCQPQTGNFGFTYIRTLLRCLLGEDGRTRVYTTSYTPFSLEWPCGVTATSTGSHKAFHDPYSFSVSLGDGVSVTAPTLRKISATYNDQQHTTQLPSCVVPTASVWVEHDGSSSGSGGTLELPTGSYYVNLGSTWASTLPNDSFVWRWKQNGTEISQNSTFGAYVSNGLTHFTLELSNSHRQVALAEVWVNVASSGYGGGSGGGGGDPGEDCERCQQWFWYIDGEIIDEWWECTPVDPSSCQQ